MSTFPGSPPVLKAGIVLLDAQTSAVQRIITLQYNPDSLSRTLQVQKVGADKGKYSEALRLTGPPVETIKIEAELDAADQLEFPDQNPNAVQFGIQPQLAALETIVYPPSDQLIAHNARAQSGVLEIAPMESPLTLLILNQRVIPVQITDFSVTEEAFDPSLNPIRAKVSIGFKVFTTDDLGFEHKGGNLYLAYQQQKERLANKAPVGTFTALGIKGIP
jgi:hypothetical protein